MAPPLVESSHYLDCWVEACGQLGAAGIRFSVEHIPHECKDQQHTMLSLTAIKLNVWKSAEVWRVYGRYNLGWE